MPTVDVPAALPRGSASRSGWLLSRFSCRPSLLFCPRPRAKSDRIFSVFVDPPLTSSLPTPLPPHSAPQANSIMVRHNRIPKRCQYPQVHTRRGTALAARPNAQGSRTQCHARTSTPELTDFAYSFSSPPRPLRLTPMSSLTVAPSLCMFPAYSADTHNESPVRRRGSQR
jgi:hypothetical protein